MAGDSQEQKYGDLALTNSSFESLQAGEDVIKAEQVTKIKQYYFSLFGDRTSEPTVDWDWAQRAVLKPLYGEIGKRLKDSLFGLAEVDGIEVEAFPQNDSPFLALEAVKTVAVDGTVEQVDPQMPMIEVYARRDVNKKLLILGTPGAGKTIALLRLAEQLVGEAIANPETIIPVIFELSTWDGQDIEAWLIEQLYENYGGKKKEKRYETWLHQRRLLPLLDGLDELGMVRQKACTEKVNEFARVYPQVVVCCRVKEFRQVGVNLSSISGKLQLQPLSDGQIRDYLRQVGKFGLWEQICDMPEMSRLLDTIVDEKDREHEEPGLLRIPLFVSLAARVYEAGNPLKGKADLFERYIDRQLSEKVRAGDRDRKEFKGRSWAFKTVRKEPNRKQVIRTLTRVALIQQELSLTEFQLKFLTKGTMDDTGLVDVYKSNYKFISTLDEYRQGIIIKVWRLSPKTMWLRSENERQALTDATYLAVLGIIFLSPIIFVAYPKWLTIFFQAYIFILIGSLTDLLIILMTFFFLDSMNQTLSKINYIHKIVENISRKVMGSIVQKSSKFYGLEDRLFHLSYNFIVKLVCIAFSISFYTLLTLYFRGLIVEFLLGLLKSPPVTSLGMAGGFILSYIFMVICISIYLKSSNVQSENIRSRKVGDHKKVDIRKLIFWLLSTNVLFLQISSFVYFQINSVSPQKYFLDIAKIPGLNDLIEAFVVIDLLCIIGIVVEFNSSGWLSQLLVRYVLCSRKIVPWNLAQFLTYCHERRLLQQIGGRYRFIHRELLDHFAGKEA